MQNTVAVIIKEQKKNSLQLLTTLATKYLSRMIYLFIVIIILKKKQLINLHKRKAVSNYFNYILFFLL